MASVKPVIVKWNGEDKSLAVLCKELGVSRNTAHKRILRGWCVEDAVNMSLKQRPKYPNISEAAPAEYINCGTGNPCN